MIKIIDAWYEHVDNNILYIQLCITEQEYVDVKIFIDDKFLNYSYYTMDAQNGYEIYKPYNDNEGIRSTTLKEIEEINNCIEIFMKGYKLRKEYVCQS